MKTETAIKDYLVEIEIKKYTAMTLKNYKNKLYAFNTFLINEMDINTVDDLSFSCIKQYTHYSMKRGVKGSTINSNLKTIKSFIQYCYEEGYGGFNTTKVKFKWVKEEKPVVKAFSTRDVRKMLESTRGNDFVSLRDTAILTMFLETGIRAFELFNLKKEHIHDDYILIYGKNHKQRVVPITPILRKALMRYERVKEVYFENKLIASFFFVSNRGNKLSNGTVDAIIKKHGASIEGVRVSAHTCRHFFAQQQIKMGVDLYTISRLLGHENISITQIYLNSLQDDDILKIARQNSVLMNM